MDLIHLSIVYAFYFVLCSRVSLTIDTFFACSLNATYQLTIYGRYIPRGTSKFGALEITSPDETNGQKTDEGSSGESQSMLKYRLFLNGKEKWSYTIHSPPLSSSSSPPPPSPADEQI